MEMIWTVIWVWFGLVALFGCKMMVDQYKLLKLYRKEINPPYPIVPGEHPADFPDEKKDPLGLSVSNRWLKIPLSKYPQHPSLDGLARKVRYDFVAAVGVGIGGFILIGCLIFVYNA